MGIRVFLLQQKNFICQAKQFFIRLILVFQIICKISIVKIIFSIERPNSKKVNVQQSPTYWVSSRTRGSTFTTFSNFLRSSKKSRNEIERNCRTFILRTASGTCFLTPLDRLLHAVKPKLKSIHTIRCISLLTLFLVIMPFYLHLHQSQKLDVLHTRISCVPNTHQ